MELAMNPVSDLTKFKSSFKWFPSEKVTRAFSPMLVSVTWLE